MRTYNFLPDEQLRTQLIEAILEYLEGNETLRSVLALGLNAYSKIASKDSRFAEIVSQLNDMNNEIAEGKSFSKENIKEIFTTMLEKLIRD